MAQKQRYVTIKGTKDGFTIMLDEHCSYAELIEEIGEKLSIPARNVDDERLVPVFLEVGNRYLSKEQIEEISGLVQQKNRLYVEKVHSNVLTKEEAERIHQRNQIVKVTKIVRSGQVLSVTGDLLLIGDVNPGAQITATGNIYVLGVLRGNAHAGVEGDDQAVIAAARMEPMQLMIANIASRSPDDSQKTVREMEYAYVDKTLQKIRVDTLHTLPLRHGMNG